MNCANFLLFFVNLSFHRLIAHFNLNTPRNRQTYSWKCYHFRRIDADQLDFSKYFHGHFLAFTGVILDFFHVHDFNFHGCNLTKIFTGKNLIFTGKLPYFSRPTELASRPKKKTLPEFEKIYKRFLIPVRPFVHLSIRTLRY